MTLLVPIGTQVVTHLDVKNRAGDVLFVAGAVGVIVKQPADPTHAYRVRFMDGSEITLKRPEFAIHKHFQNPVDATEAAAKHDLYQYVIFRCIVGSKAYGLDHENSDVDRRGIYLPPADLHWSMFGVPEQLENDAAQEVYWELEKFLVLALKANPNILEALYSPLIEQVTPLAQQLIDLRAIFLSRLIYQTYNGYVMSQFKKLEKDLENYGTLRWKHAMHLIRLLLSGIVALNEGYIPVRVTEHRDQLLAIRRAEVAWTEVNQWRLDLHQQFDLAYQHTKLPDRPDYERANAFLVAARRSVV
ncbi:MAG: nucleotidyltransferase domain-containing protein [Chloroflexi bacterium]|nr:nucleotidyltransferase domain-containing protein [Chloroflexota bacterium]